MRLSRLYAKMVDGYVRMFGDCDDCGHSFMYHLPLAGCIKCNCGEFS